MTSILVSYRVALKVNDGQHPSTKGEIGSFLPFFFVFLSLLSFCLYGFFVFLSLLSFFVFVFLSFLSFKDEPVPQG